VDGRNKSGHDGICGSTSISIGMIRTLARASMDQRPARRCAFSRSGDEAELMTGYTNDHWDDLSTSSWPGSSPQVGFTRLAALYSAELAQARVPMPSTSWMLHGLEDVDARDKRGHDE
jgi:hypothetical protein